MKNYYDMSKVDFVVDRTEYIIEVHKDMSLANWGMPLSHPIKRKNPNPTMKLNVQINGGRFTLEGDKAERFIEQFEEYQQNKEKGLVK